MSYSSRGFTDSWDHNAGGVQCWDGIHILLVFLLGAQELQSDPI